MEKTEIRPLFQFMASQPKNSNFEGVKIFVGPKIILGYPILGFLTLRSTKKLYFSSKPKIGSQFQFTCFLPKKSNFEGVKIFLGPRICLRYPILIFLILESTKNSFLHQKYHKICKLKYCQFCDVFDEKNHFFGTFRGQKS